MLVDMAGELGFDPREPLRAWALVSPWLVFLDHTSLPQSTPLVRKLALLNPDDIPRGSSLNCWILTSSSPPAGP